MGTKLGQRRRRKQLLTQRVDARRFEPDVDWRELYETIVTANDGTDVVAPVVMRLLPRSVVASGTRQEDTPLFISQYFDNSEQGGS